MCAVQSLGGEGMTDEERKLKQQKAMADPEIQVSLLPPRPFLRAARLRPLVLAYLDAPRIPSAHYLQKIALKRVACSSS